ncbi:hypothetical protein ARMGADRAFT_41860 [Armillaria gallica]|uniref:C2H2-type domain-containing protein n=1 Tax=Armillaria gallica TaxID=47427 RepID=A0A2H3EUL9_ARMGA|nr:hypothetical protein ARMGADRAFT_41860 [Armillaria gallica]
MNSPPTSPVQRRASAGRDQGNNPDAQYLHICDFPDCGIAFDRREVSKHIFNYHLHGVDQWDTIICPLDQTKMRARNLARHYETKHLRARVSCPYCPREYSRRDTLVRHLRESCPSRLQG